MAQGVQWKDQGASLTLTFQDLKITRVSDNKSITINGTQTYTNVTGGLLINLLTLGTITHSITSSNMSITFDDGTQRTWNVAKQRVYTFSGTNVSVTISGTHTEGNVTNIAEWGTNRLGHAFTSSTVQPVVIRSDCNFRVTSGEIRHTLPHVTADATFGLDSNGNPTSCPGAGHYYFKIVFTGSGGNSVTLIMAYELFKKIFGAALTYRGGFFMAVIFTLIDSLLHLHQEVILSLVISAQFWLNLLRPVSY